MPGMGLGTGHRRIYKQGPALGGEGGEWGDHRMAEELTNEPL